jgi:hypothetical protein
MMLFIRLWLLSTGLTLFDFFFSWKRIGRREREETEGATVKTSVYRMAGSIGTFFLIKGRHLPPKKQNGWHTTKTTTASSDGIV